MPGNRCQSGENFVLIGGTVVRGKKDINTYCLNDVL